MGLKAVSTSSAQTGTIIANVPADGTTDATTALQSVFNSVPTAGATVLLPAGTILISNTITIPTKCTIVGQGDAESLGNPCTRIVISSATLDALSVTASGVSMRGFMVQNVLGLNGLYMSTNGLNRIYNTTQVPTAGTGIRYTNLGSGQVNPQSGDLIHLDNITVQGFYNNYRFDAGFYYDMKGCKSFDAVNYMAYFNNLSSDGGDHGDQSISECTFSSMQSQRNAFAAIRWESGGGLRFVNNKINGTEQPVFPPSYVGQTGGSGQTIGTQGKPQYGIFLALGENGTDNTSVCVISDNSIENCSSQCIAMVHGGTQSTNPSTFGRIVISGNEFLGPGMIIGPNDNANTTVWSNVAIVNNIFSSGSFVNLYNIAGGTVTGNHFKSGGIALNGKTGCSDVITYPNIYSGDSIQIFNTSVLSNQNGQGNLGQQARVPYAREIPAYTANVTQTLYRLQMTNFQDGIVEFTMAGNLNTIGGQVTQAKFYFSRGNGGAVTVTQIGTTLGVDASAVNFVNGTLTGTNYTIFVDTTTVSGEVRISFQTAKASFIGVFDMVIIGNLFGIKKGV